MAVEAVITSDDPAVWARAFVEDAKAHPEIAVSEIAMRVWFAEALKRGKQT